METDKIVESVKFLLTSVRRLSDHLLESDESNRTALQDVWDHGISSLQADIDKIKQQIDAITLRISQQEAKHLSVPISGSTTNAPESNYRLGKEKGESPLPPSIQPLNLTEDSILDVYRKTPVLLHPFSRSCSVSSRTLSGMIDEVEIELFAQGANWIIETIDGDWLLIPRPGILSRPSQIQSLERIYQIDAKAELPAELELLKPGRASVVEHGKRWYLTSKGTVGLQLDPLKHSVEKRLLNLETRLKILEEN